MLDFWNSQVYFYQDFGESSVIDVAASEALILAFAFSSRNVPLLRPQRREIGWLFGSLDASLFFEEKLAMADDRHIEQRNKQLIQAGFDAWRNGTGGVFDLLAIDAKWTIVGNSPVSRTFTSRQEFLDVVINPFNERLSSRLVPTVPALYADGDTVIALFDAEGTARDGQPYRNTYSWYMQMRDDKIMKVTAFFDTIGFTDFWNRIKPEVQHSQSGA
jgi:uncharacterized protein